jgi:hypothetical protein
MLYALENLLVPALRATLPAAVGVAVGPPVEVPPASGERVDLIAADLRVKVNPSEPLEAREPTFLFQVQKWGADGTIKDFALPSEAKGEVFEVESPPGHPVRRGEDYAVDGKTLRFYRPPAAAATAVTATLRTGPATGFQERRPCTAQLSITTWGTDFPRTDHLLDQALSVVLATCVGLGTLEAQGLEAGIRMRLLRPALVLEQIDRSQFKAGEKWAPRAVARLRLEADLELVVALGTPEPEGIMEKIAYHADVAGPGARGGR